MGVRRGSLIVRHATLKDEHHIPPEHVEGTLKVLEVRESDTHARLIDTIDGLGGWSKGRMALRVSMPHDAYFEILRVSRDVMAGMAPMGHIGVDRTKEWWK